MSKFTLNKYDGHLQRFAEFLRSTKQGATKKRMTELETLSRGDLVRYRPPVGRRIWATVLDYHRTIGVKVKRTRASPTWIPNEWVDKVKFTAGTIERRGRQPLSARCRLLDPQ